MYHNCTFEANSFGFMQKRIVTELQNEIVDKADPSLPLLQDNVLNPQIQYR